MCNIYNYIHVHVPVNTLHRRLQNQNTCQSGAITNSCIRVALIYIFVYTHLYMINLDYLLSSYIVTYHNRCNAVLNL